MKFNHLTWHSEIGEEIQIYRASKSIYYEDFPVISFEYKIWRSVETDKSDKFICEICNEESDTPYNLDGTFSSFEEAADV